MPDHFPSQDAAPLPVTQPHRHKWWILIAIGLTLFMGAVDGTIVNVALPSLTRELQTDFRTVQWVVLAFLVGLAVLILSMGRLGDMVGKKVVFTTGLVIFVVGSALCGLAPNVYWLIGFRFLQSIGAAMTLALGVAIVTETWPLHERGKAIGISAGIISLGIAAGPAVGGILLQMTGWRWIFFVNLPIGVLSLALVLAFVPALAPSKRGESFDFAGAALIGVMLLALTVAMTLGQVDGFLSAIVLGLLLLSLVCLLAFVRTERRVAYPMINLSLFRNATFSLNLFTGFLTFVGIAGVVLLFPFYLQLVMGLQQGQVGLLMAVVPLVLAILNPISGVLSDRVGTRPVSIVGLILLVLGYLALTRLNTSSTVGQYLIYLLPVGLGMGTFQSPNNTSIMSAVPRNRLGVASGTLSMTRTLGQTAGIAVLGAYFVSRLQVYAGQAVDITTASANAIVEAMHDEFIVVAGLIAIGLVVALWQWRVEARAGRNE